MINVQNWNFINLFQIYEWYTMHCIVSYQKDKSFGEILSEIQNQTTFLEFVRKEKLRKKCFYAFGVFVYSLTILQTSTRIINCNYQVCESTFVFEFSLYAQKILSSIESVQIFLMLAMLFLTIYYLSKFHFFEYKLRRNSLLTFGVCITIL